MAFILKMWKRRVLLINLKNNDDKCNNNSECNFTEIHNTTHELT